MTTTPSKTTIIAIAGLAMGVGCAGDAAVESAEEESTTGGEAEASCSVESGSPESPTAASNDDSSAGDAEASCGEGSCG